MNCTNSDTLISLYSGWGKDFCVLLDSDEAGENGKIFGGVSAKDISENLEKQHKIKIDKKKIDLKETIKNKYIEDYGQEKYDQVQESYDEAKENVTETAKNTYNVIIDVTSDFYEETKNKAENWYKNYKESRN